MKQISYLCGDTLLSFITILLIAAYTFFKLKCTYWKRQNIENAEGCIVFGNFFKCVARRQMLFLVFDEIYRKIKGPFGGFYSFTGASLLIRDPQLMKQILIKEFNVFPDRGMYVNEDFEPLTGNLFAMRNEQSRFWRTKLTPLFSTDKLKQMTPSIACIGLRLRDYLKRRSRSEKSVIIELRDLMSRYTTDVICSVGFGIDIDSINDEKNIFRIYGSRIARPSRWILFCNMLAIFTPSITRNFKIRTTDKDVENFLRKVTEEIIDLRENKKLVRHDFMQLLIQLRNSGVVNEDGNWFTNIGE